MDWAEMLMRMVTVGADQHGFKTSDVVDIQNDTPAVLRAAQLFVWQPKGTSSPSSG